MESENNNMEQEVLSERRTPPGKRTRKKKKKSWIALVVIFSVFALIVGGGIYAVQHYLGKINIIDPETESVLSPSEFAEAESKYWESVNNPNYTEPDPEADTTEAYVDETQEDPVVKVVRAPFQADAYRATLSADDEQVIFDHPVTPTITNTGSLNDEDLINIMLVGQDTRYTSYRERSDTMILVSINTKTHKVALISFLRDLYVPLGDGYGWNRLNNAFKIGGLKKMYKVYEDVFGLHIDGGIYINFGQFMSLVNLLGGVDVTLTEKEAKWLRTTLEQSVPDMRYWGQIVEAKMPSIKSGTTVKDAISALTSAQLSYAYADANGGAAPDDITKATVKALYLDAAGKSTAKAGKYYGLNTTIYIKYTETRITFPTIPAEASVESVVKLLTNNGFKVAYADRNGNAAPYDSKSALVAGVYKDAAGKSTFNAGDKFDKDTLAYIAYTENVASVPTIPSGATVEEAESLLKAAGLGVSWSAQNGGAAPADKTKAKVTGVWRDKEGTKALNAGDKIDINATVYLSYELIEEPTTEEPTTEETPTTEEPTTEEPTTEEPTTEEAPTQCAHTYGSSWTSANNGTHYHVCTKCGAGRVDESCDAYFTEVSHQDANCTSAGSRTLKCSRCGYEKTETVGQALGHDLGAWTSNNNGTHSRRCSRCGAEARENCRYTNGVCTVCGYHDPEYHQETTEAPTTPEPTTPEQTTAAPTTAEQTTAPTTAEPTTEAPTQAPEEPAPGDAGQSNEGLTAGQNSSLKGLYNPVVKPLSSSSGSSSEPYYLRNIKAGRVHLDGMQTLAYCRMRKLDSDFKRTERQRTVLNILFNKIKSSSISTLNNLLEEILPQVTTDLSKAEILQIAAAVLPYFSSINLQMHSIPADGTYACVMINGMAVVTFNQAANISALRSWLPY